jgi:uncharacterized protein YbjT (DUF2867 family)
MRILVTGATGYVGGRLVPKLLETGARVRCLVRDATKLDGARWRDRVEVAEADLLDGAALTSALSGVDVAYYLVHAIDTGADFAARDREMAHMFAAGARAAGVRRIIYLGGLGDAESAELSAHLSSRAEVGRILSEHGVPTVTLRAAVIIGTGSVSFEMLRYLTERLPVMVTPSWVRTRIQPIAIDDVLHYLTEAAELPEGIDRDFDIGGPDILDYQEMMQRYAAAAGLIHRLVFPVPLLSPWLSSLWVGLITPVPGAIARPLVDSLRNEVVCHDHEISGLVPEAPTGLLGIDEALRRALSPQDPASDVLPTDPDWAGGARHIAERRATVDASPERVWRVATTLGEADDSAGWTSGLARRLLGGRRPRRTGEPRVGDVVGMWRVEDVQTGHLLRLRAETRMPGEARLELRVEHTEPPVLVQRLVFRPRGLAGEIYWNLARLTHQLLFDRLLHALSARRSPAPTG